MSRPLRIMYDGAWYHVMNRDADFAQLLATREQSQGSNYISDVLNFALRLFNNRTFKVHGAEA